MKKQLLFMAFAMCSLIGFGQVPSYVPSNGLVGYWPFNGNANDESGNGNNGTVNGATLTADRDGTANSAYNFDGVNDWIETTYLGVPGSSSRTVSFWFRSDEHTYRQSIFSYGASGFNGSAFRAWTGWNCTSIGFDTDGAAIDLEPIFNASDWNNFTLVFDNTQGLTSGAVLYYANGEFVQTFCSEVNSSQIINTPSLYGLTFGKYHADALNYLNGVLDDIGIWNRALTQEEIQALYIGCNVAPTTIAGNLSPATLTSADYACNNNSGSTYQWTVTNGVITAGQGTSNVTVLWGAEGIGTLSVVETNADGCSGTPANIQVDVVCSTTATAITGPLGPNALTNTTYSCNGDAGSTYLWTISNGVLTSGQGTNTVTVLWAGTGLGNISVQETTNANCVGNTISMDVVVIPTGVDELEYPISAIYPNPAKDIVTIDFGKASSVHGQSIEIVNSLGQVVYTSNVTSQLALVDVSTWASGTYLISILNGTGTQVQTKTLIIE